jgi:GntR family transcriptional repressor for pyruvate dehydrogenase complex
MNRTALFEKLELAPAYRQVAQAIEEMITTGRLRPDEWLPTEADLSAQFGVNRSTIREGIRVLEHAGLVRRDGKRLRVTIPHYMDLASRASRALALHQVTFRELWEVSVELESISAAFAADRIDEAGLKALDTNIEEMRERLNDIDSVIALDIEFHDLLAEASGNRALALAREPISLLFHPAGATILPRLGTQGRILEAHVKIVELMRAHDVAGVKQWMERHMHDFRRGYERTGISMTEPLDSVRFKN